MHIFPTGVTHFRNGWQVCYPKTLNAHISKQWLSYKLTYFPNHLVNIEIFECFYFQNDRRCILFQKMHSTHFWQKVFCVRFHKDVAHFYLHWRLRPLTIWGQSCYAMLILCRNNIRVIPWKSHPEKRPKWEFLTWQVMIPLVYPTDRRHRSDADRSPQWPPGG